MRAPWPVPAVLSVAGLAHRPLRWLLLALGVAVAAVLPVLASGIAVTAQGAAVSQAVNDLPSDERTVTAITSRTSDPAVADAVSGEISAALGSLSGEPVERVLMYRQLSVNGSTFTLGGTDRLTADVDLKSGRLPTSCHPGRCEVVLTVARSGASAGAGPVPADFASAAAQLGLVVTGSAVLDDEHLFSGGLATEDQPLLLGAAPAPVARLAALELFGRNNAWTVPLDPVRVNDIGPAEFGARLDAFTDRINVGVGGVTVSWPQQAVDVAHDRAVRSADRFTLLGATTSVIMVGFALVASIGLRRRHQLLLRVLARRGAGALVIAAVPAIQVFVCTVVGLLAGIGLGAVAAARYAAGVSGSPHNVATAAVAGSWPSLAALGGSVVVVALAALLWPDRSNRSVQLATDLLTVACIAGIALALSGGSAAGASPNGAGPLVQSIVALVAVTTGLVAARIWSPIIGLFRRGLAGRHGPAGLVADLAVLGGVRRPLRPAVTAGFVAASIAATVFAGAYSATLRASASDQAAYQVPLDVRITSSASVPAPSTVVDLGTVRVAGASAFPVVTSAAEAFAGTENAVGLPLVGLDPAAIAAMHNFAQTTGAVISAPALGGALAAAGRSAAPAAGPTVAASTRDLRIAGTGGSVDYDVALWVVTESGTEQQLPLRAVAGGFEGSPAALAGDRGTLKIIAAEVTESAYHLVHRQHAVGEGNSDQAQASGVVTMATVTADGHRLDWTWQGWGSDHATATTGAGSLRLAFQINDTRIIASPGFVPAGDIPPLPVAVDPATASLAHTGSIAITVAGLSTTGRVVAVLPRLPTFGGRFVLADRSAVAELLDRVEPGTAYTSQIWISLPSAAQSKVAAYLQTYPVDGATIATRQSAERRLADDPVTTGSEFLLAFAGVAALVMAMIALMITVRADRNDESGDYLAWESDGMTPRSIRTVIFLRVCSVLVVAVPLGLAGGLALTAAATVLIAIGSSGYVPVPPVQLVIGAASTAQLLAAAVGVALAGTLVATALSLREHLPPVPEVDLR